MEISSSDLKNKCLKFFKKCSPPIIFDRAFRIISKQKMQDIVNKNSVTYMPYIPELFDCNRFSRALISDISKWQVKEYRENKDKEMGFPVCIGFCLIEANPIHSLCLILCHEGFFYVEPQSNELIKIQDPSEVLFIEF